MMMHKNASVDPHNFAMVPRADIPQSKFNIQSALKTTFDGAWLVRSTWMRFYLATPSTYA